MKHAPLTINEFLEDFDNEELSEYDWTERMREAVAEYNNEYGTVYDLDKAVQRYQGWKREQHKMDM